MNRCLFSTLFVAGIVPLVTSVCCNENRKQAPPAVTSAGSSSAPLTRAACEVLLKSADEKYEMLHRVADKRCSTVEDCVTVQRSCRAPTCGEGAIAKAALTEHSHKTSGAAADCERFHQTCRDLLPLPIPSCLAYRLECKNGECVNAPVK